MSQLVGQPYSHGLKRFGTPAGSTRTFCMKILVVVLVIAAFLGIIPAGIASNKGRSFFGWWVYGWVLLPVALIHSLVTKPTSNVELQSELVECPDCAESVPRGASECKYCGKVGPYRWEYR